jgi:hypothetical protein
MPAWTVVCEPINEDGKAGLVVKLVQASGNTYTAEYEVGRVAFVRVGSKNPKKTFQAVLADVLDRAGVAVEIVNDFQSEMDRANEIAEQEHADRLGSMAEEALNKLRDAFPNAKQMA